MTENNSNKLFSCKLCHKETTNIVNCIGCKDLFCFNHLNQHHQQLSNDIDQLIKRHVHINDQSFKQLNINQHMEFIDKWEYETIELIHQHTKYVKEKILSIFNKYKSELKQYHTILGKELNDKQDLKKFIEHDLTELSQRIEQLDKEIQHVNQVLHQISLNELNQIVNKFSLSTNSIGKKLFKYYQNKKSSNNYQKKSIQWKYLREIKLDSTYGYMAANNQHIFLGWKNRIVIYNINGTKHDETRLQSTEIYGELCDIIWSSTMERFFILCRKSLFVHYPSSSQVEILSKISLINQNNQYISITTYKNNLFLLNEKSLDIWIYKTDIFVLDCSILITLIIQNSFDENICCIRTNEQHLAILIQNKKTHTWHLDLFNIYPFQRIYMGISFDRFIQPYLGLIMAFHNNIYLFMNWETKLMHMIDQNGSNQIIDYNAYNACLLGTKRMLIVNYMTHLKIYEF